MKTFSLFLSLLLALSTAPLRAQDASSAGHPPATAGATSRPATNAPFDDVLYEDPQGQTSATVTQVLGDRGIDVQNTTYVNVRRIRYRNDVFILEHGESATVLLPKQFVASIALNRRTGNALPPPPSRAP
jgi:hypothetical protein